MPKSRYLVVVVYPRRFEPGPVTIGAWLAPALSKNITGGQLTPIQKYFSKDGGNLQITYVHGQIFMRVEVNCELPTEVDVMVALLRHLILKHLKVKAVIRPLRDEKQVQRALTPPAPSRIPTAEVFSFADEKRRRKKN